MIVMKKSILGQKSMVYRCGRRTALALLCTILTFAASAQRDIFKAEVSGAFAAVNSNDFALPDDPSLFAAGGRFQVNWGRAWQAGLHIGHFNFGEAAELERSYAGLSLAYLWDNGTLLRQRALLAPYHLIDLGYFGAADIEGGNVTGSSAAAGIENGIKIRTGDRFTVRIAHAVYRELDSRGFDETLGSDGISLWRVGIGYHFGAVRANFDGPRFDASARFDKGSVPEASIRPVLSVALPEKMTETPAPPEPKPSFADSARTEPEVSAQDPAVSRRDTVFIVSRDTVYLDSLGQRRFVDRRDDSLYINLQQRVNYLEGLAAGLSRRDTLTVLREDAPVSREEAQPAASKAAAEPEGKSARSEETEARPEEKSTAEKRTYATDPAIIASMERQEELIRTQNRILSELAGRRTEVNVEAPRERRRPQVAPTVAIPLGGGGDRGESERIANLEKEVRELRAMLLGSTAFAVKQDSLNTADSAAVATTDTRDLELTPDSLSADTAARTEAKAETGTGTAQDSLLAQAESISARADSIAKVNIRKAEERRAAEKVTEEAAQPYSDFDSEPSSNHSAQRAASYPAVFKFGLNRDDVDENYAALFDEVAADMKADPESVAEITGFTDSSGNAEYNRQLSKRRAENIKRRLTARGIDASRLRIRGEGADRAEEKWNPGDRRVEIFLK